MESFYAQQRAQTIQQSAQNDKAIGYWLVASAVMVFVMMIIGAITRLTESGLSMVEWRPLIGALPPLSELEWQRVFDLYRGTSEYQIANVGMSLEEFKTIFWWEYIHRLWGRLIGLVYGVPFFFFLFKGRLPQGQKQHYWSLLFLGGLQGVIGWWMVKSGFVDRDDVSQYRLAVHLGMAFLILGYLTWMAIGVLAPIENGRSTVPRSFRRLGAWAHAIIFFTVISGAFVAGSNAGFIYNDWPLMNGAWTPDDFWSPEYGLASAFEEHGTIQFNHRLIAYLALILITFTWIQSLRPAIRQSLAPRTRSAAHLLLLSIWGQATLGVATLISVINLPLAVMHQAGAIITFIISLWLLKELRGQA